MASYCIYCHWGFTYWQQWPVIYPVRSLFCFINRILLGKNYLFSNYGHFCCRFNLYLKLFIVMGINWAMELVSFAVGGPKFLWFVTDFGNTLQGLLIFLIFVWKRRILRLLNQKLCPQWNLVSATSTSKGSKVSSGRTSSSNLSKTVNSNPDNVSMQPIARKVSTSDDSDGNN